MTSDSQTDEDAQGTDLEWAVTVLINEGEAEEATILDYKLTRRESGYWDVWVGSGDDAKYVDAINPSQFQSASSLMAYLNELDIEANTDQEHDTLPEHHHREPGVH